MRALAKRLDRLHERARLLPSALSLEDASLRDRLLSDQIAFTGRFFEDRTGTAMLVAPFHRVIADALEKVRRGIYTRLIINIPPGYTKTELAVINFIAHGLAINKSARFLHLSYSEDLALLNSTTARNIIKAPDFQRLWPTAIRADTDNKAMWWTMQGGGVRAAASGGQVTGFRAGHMNEGIFTGSLVCDDPLKPADAFSEKLRTGVNETFSNTTKSRLAVESVPIVVIMQRIHYHDLSGYLLRGGSGEKWHHLCLPVLIDNAAPYPEENTHGIPILHGLPDGWLWPKKHREEHRAALESHRRTFEAQYMQAPKRFADAGALWSEAQISSARNMQFSETWKLRTVVAIDPAAKSKDGSDETGIIVASRYADERGSVDADYTGRMTPQAWAGAAIKAYHEHNADAIVIETNQGGEMAEQTLRSAGYSGRIVGVHASKGKTTRAEPISVLYCQGRIGHTGNLYQLENEMLEYQPLQEIKKSPNRMDAMVWAFTELFPQRTMAFL